MLNIILSIKRTQVHCTQILSTLFTCLHVMTNTDVKQNEMQTWYLNADCCLSGQCYPCVAGHKSSVTFTKSIEN